MARQLINVGTGPNSLNGDVLRNAFIKTNDNFVELYQYNQEIPVTVTEITSNMFLNGLHNGITVSYDPVNFTLNLTGFTGAYSPTIPADWNGTPPTTIAEAIDRLAAVVKTLNNGTGA